jgi:membrane-associated phospholipid phosphatase
VVPERIRAADTLEIRPFRASTAAQPDIREDELMTTLEDRPVTTSPSRGVWYLCAPVVVAVLAAAGVAAIYQVFVRSGLGQSVDTSALRGADVDHPRVVEVLSRTLDGTSLGSLVLVCLGAAAIGVVRRRIDLAAGAAVLVLGANITTQLLKTRLARPDLDGFPAPNSFPSGHTSAAGAVAFALVLVLPAAIRGMVALIGATYVAVIAVATVWAEWHRPSDTVAALLVVLAWGGLVTAVLRARRLRRIAGRPARPNRLATLVFLTVGAISAAAGLVGLAAVVLSERVTPDLVSGRFAFLTGAACITAAVAVTFLLWVRLTAGDQPADAVPAEGGATT